MKIHWPVIKVIAIVGLAIGTAVFIPQVLGLRLHTVSADSGAWDPVLSLSESATAEPLLGGSVHYSITIQSTGDNLPPRVMRIRTSWLLPIRSVQPLI